MYDEAARDPEAWWAKQARALDWFVEPWDQVLDDSNPPFYNWFTGGKLNASHNCLDRHVEAGLGDRVAYHWRGEEGEERDVTYADLLRDTKRLANVLKDRGVEAGDVVGIFLPMIPEVVVAMLACARVGAPHNVVFGGFSPESVKERMEFSEAKALITVDARAPQGQGGRDQARGGRVPRGRALDRDRDRGPPHRRRGGDEGGARPVLRRGDRGRLQDCPPAELDAEHPLFVLYTSGSTAKPKGIQHTTGGYLSHVAWTTATCSTCGRTRTCSGARPTSAGSPATPTSSTGRS